LIFGEWNLKEYDQGVLELSYYLLKELENGASKEQIIFDLGRIMHTLAENSHSTIKACFLDQSNSTKVSLIADTLQKLEA
jgi:hypothetical protein